MLRKIWDNSKDWRDNIFNKLICITPLSIVSVVWENCGEEGIRTLDLLTASQTL